MTKTIIIASTPPGIDQPQADFNPTDINALIWQKGYRVIHEKALRCPCKGANTNQLSNCQNCGGTGWAFINPTDTRMVLHSMNMNTQYKEWSQENQGQVNISSMERDQITFMDRITVVDGNAVFTEARTVKKTDSGTLFIYASYNIKSMLYIARFVSATQKYLPLIEGTDFTIKDNQITFDNKFTDDLSVTMRYTHAPQYHVIDLNRELMNSFAKEGGVETNNTLPVSAIGRRAHYILDAENLSGTRMLDNSLYSCGDNTESKVC
jgi:hypothetical protein